MKKLIIIICFFLIVNQNFAQSFTTYTDTAHYLMNEIEGKKSLYIGKPFHVLYDSLKMKPVSAMAAGAMKKEFFFSSVHFNFNNILDFYEAHYLVITFQITPSYEVLLPLFHPEKGRLGKIEDILAVYKPLIVKDVVTKDYYESPEGDPVVKTNTSDALTEQQKEIIAHIENYKYFGQSFSVLWNDLAIKPKTIWGIDYLQGISTDPNKEIVTRFYYETMDNLSDTYIEVEWKPAIPKTETQQYQLATLRDFRAPREYEIYKDKIIQNVTIFPKSLYPNGIDILYPMRQKPKDVK